MKHLIIIIILFLTPLLSFSQTVKTTTGNWNDASKWSGSNIGDVVTETVSLSQNTTSTILNGETYTINNLTMNQNDKLYVNTGGTLNVGDATHAASFTTDQNNELYIDGTFTVWAPASALMGTFSHTSTYLHAAPNDTHGTQACQAVRAVRTRRCQLPFSVIRRPRATPA